MAKSAFILILVGDEERGHRLREALRTGLGYPCLLVTDLNSALDSIRERTPDVVVADPEIGGAPALEPLVELLDGLARDSTLVSLGQAAAPAKKRHVHFVAIDATDDREIVSTLGRLADKAVARREDRLLKQSLAERPIEAFEGIVGSSPAIQRITDRIRKAARNKLTVLILGETGTGKELIARAIHNQSDRAKKPFKWLNCAGLNENLLESELFGHVRGAYTGAVSDRKGYFVAADGGTLFLDEIGDMPTNMQAKLLRALEQREITPVGSTEVRKVDVRVIAATNVDLRRAVDDKKFREDLFYRLHQWEILVPPLRERRGDVPILAQHLLEKANNTHGTNVPSISGEAMQLLVKYVWPGNVRELENVIASVACEVVDRQIEADDLPEIIRGTRDIVPASAGGLVGLSMAQIEKMAIVRALEATGGNREQAAKMLGIGIRTLYRKLKEFDL
ncbi:MAG: sigma-54-dependent Fis family transcriptional regulator [Phycisphaerales bacterium]|nr:sigma-54-dependent Fis family transcriptional regulator [Phycisphaerales bacterium]